MNLPSWNDAPSWAVALALDWNGLWHWFSVNPYPNYLNGTWDVQGAFQIKLAGKYHQPPVETWNSICFERPAKITLPRTLELMTKLYVHG